MPALPSCFVSRVAQMRTRCVMASFLSNLSWHDDNKIQMYQASEEVMFLFRLLHIQTEPVCFPLMACRAAHA